MDIKKIVTTIVIVALLLIGVSAVVPAGPAVFWSTFYSEAKEWQTGIGAFFGLVVILIGALYNAELNRDRDDRLRREDARAGPRPFQRT